jgi:hypothetical protein
MRRRDSAVGIATGYQLDGRGVGVRVPARERSFFFQVVQTGSWAHLASNSMGIGHFLLGGKAAEA